MRWFFRLLPWIALFLAAWWLIGLDASLTLITPTMSATMQAGVALIFLLLLFVLMFMLDRIWLRLKLFPERWRTKRGKRVWLRGEENLLKGLTALASGDYPQAMQLAAQAKPDLSEQASPLFPLIYLVAAQSALHQEYWDEAEHYYNKLTEYDQTIFLGLRGLSLLAMNRLRLADHKASRQERLHDALQIAERAWSLKPEARWLPPVLAELYGRSGRWSRAHEVLLESRARQGLTPEGQHLLALTLTRLSYDALAAKSYTRASEEAEQAVQQDQRFLPAWLVWAESAMKLEKKKAASSIIERAWKHTPHPQLLTFQLGLFPTATAEAKLKEVQKLVKQAPDHWESHIAIATVALEARDPLKARNHLKLAMQQKETVRLCQMMAEAERMLAQMEKKKTNPQDDQWLRRAQTATPDPAWRCQQCATTYVRWHSICEKCDGFDMIEWSYAQKPIKAKSTAPKSDILLP